MSEQIVSENNVKPPKKPKNRIYNMQEIAYELHVSKEIIRAANKAVTSFCRFQ